MRKVLYFAILAMALTAARGADPKWIRMPSADFEIYSSAGEGDTRRALQNFERVRDFFEQSMHSSGQKKRDPVRVIIFGSKKEYAVYRPNEFADAFYVPIAGRDYIVLGSASDDVFPIAIHEYVHLVAQNLGLKLPPWLNEGMAEVFSTLKPSGDKVIVGTPILGRMQALFREKWVPLSIIVGSDRNSPYYNEKNKAGSLYNEGWALTHMLELNAQYSPHFREMMAEIQKGTPSQKAIEVAYGKPLEIVEKELQAYVRGNTFMGAIFAVKLHSGEKVAAEPAAMFDVKLALLDLANRPGKEAETRERLHELMTDDPKRPEPHVALGYLAGRAGQQEEARQSFEKAFDLGSRNPQMLWDYGRMAGQANPPQAMRALTLLLADEPDRLEVRLALAGLQMNGKLAKEALETLSPVKKVTPEDAPRLFQILAFANLQTGNRAAARANAQRWIENTQDASENIRASQVIRYLDQQEAAGRQAAVSSPPPPPPPQMLDADSTDARPTLARRTPPPNLVGDRSPARLNLPSIAGTLMELDCTGPQPKFVLQTESGRLSFLMDDPRNIRITGLPEDNIDMNCGPLKRTAVQIQYDPSVAASTEVRGAVRAIHYEQAAGK